MKIIDAFIFYNELELLNYRLHILHEVVDYFIIVESRHTFTGKEKECFYETNKYLFEKYQEKIIHIIVDDFPFVFPNINIRNGEQWTNEKYQRNQITRGWSTLELSGEDILLITDLDEIPNRTILEKVRNQELKIDIHILEMDFYYCNLNHKKNMKWTAARILSFERYQALNLSCEEIRMYDTCPSIAEGGWHLSYFGDSQFIRNKIEHFSHQELNFDRFTNISKIEERLKSFSDLFDRTDPDNQVIRISVNENTFLPYEYDTYLQQFILF